MASKTDQWKRLYSLPIDPEAVAILVVERDGQQQRWLTDKYVLINLDVADVPVINTVELPNGPCRLRASQPPVKDDGGCKITTRALDSWLNHCAKVHRWTPLMVTDWSASHMGEPVRLMIRHEEIGQVGVLVRNSVVREWQSAFPDRRDTLRFEQAAGARSHEVVRVILHHDYGYGTQGAASDQVLGHVMPIRWTEQHMPRPLPDFTIVGDNGFTWRVAA